MAQRTQEKIRYKVYSIESKGGHLKNEDTEYKRGVKNFCNELGIQKHWTDVSSEFSDQKIEFQLIYEDEWRKKINEIFDLDAAKKTKNRPR